MAPSPSLLDADQNYKLVGESTAPPNSASSSSTAATPPQDKRTTRDQPNLSDCHCCNCHINHTNPKDRLQPLSSFWRIVLLCRKCLKKVSSGQTCTYCFQQTQNSCEIVTCGSCERRIHKDCVRDYGSSAPWCYLAAGVGEFRTCLDCWVPDSLKRSVRGRGRSVRKGVSGEDKVEGNDGLDEVMRNAKFQVEKKVKMAAKAKEHELRKAMAAKKALYLANGALILAKKAKKQSDRGKGGSSSSSNAVGIADDAELAAQFRRIFTCSRKISRKEFCLDPRDLSVWKLRSWSGITYKRFCWRKELGKCERMNSSSVENDIVEENGSSSDVHGSTRVLTYKRDKKRKVWQVDDPNLMVLGSNSIQHEEMLELHSDGTRNNCSIDVSDTELCVDASESGFCTDTGRFISEALICVDPEQRSSCINVDRFGRNLAIYKRSKFRAKGQVNGVVYVPGESHPCHNQEVTYKPEHNQSDDKKHMVHFLVKCEDEEILPNGSSNSEQDRYYLKYYKRVGTTKSYLSRLCSDTGQCEKQSSEPALSNSDTDSSLNSDHHLRLPHESSCVGLDRYCIKYVKRVKSSKSGSIPENKLHAHSIQHQNEASSGLVHHTAESRTMSSCS